MDSDGPAEEAVTGLFPGGDPYDNRAEPARGIDEWLKQAGQPQDARKGPRR
jgi:hypothetical protein